MDRKFDLINDAFGEIDQITDKLFEDLSQIYDKEEGIHRQLPDLFCSNITGDLKSLSPVKKRRELLLTSALARKVRRVTIGDTIFFDGSEIVVPVKLDAVLSANIKVSKFDIKALYLDLEKAKFENEVKRIFLKGNYRYTGNGDDRQAFDELDGEMKEAMSYHQTTNGG